MTYTSTAQEQERAEFEARFKHLNLTQEPDAWGASRYKHAAIWLAWEAWQAARRAPAAPVPQGMEQDAARYQALVESGNFAPSPFDNGMWGLRVSRVPSTKAELDAAVDRAIAAQAKQGGV